MVQIINIDHRQLYLVFPYIEEVQKNSSKIKDAKKFDVHVVSENFLKAVKKGKAALMITEHSIAEWGAAVSTCK